MNEMAKDSRINGADPSEQQKSAGEWTDFSVGETGRGKPERKITELTKAAESSDAAVEIAQKFPDMHLLSNEEIRHCWGPDDFHVAVKAADAWRQATGQNGTPCCLSHRGLLLTITPGMTPEELATSYQKAMDQVTQAEMNKLKNAGFTPEEIKPLHVGMTGDYGFYAKPVPLQASVMEIGSVSLDEVLEQAQQRYVELNSDPGCRKAVIFHYNGAALFIAGTHDAQRAKQDYEDFKYEQKRDRQDTVRALVGMKGEYEIGQKYPDFDLEVLGRLRGTPEDNAGTISNSLASSAKAVLCKVDGVTVLVKVGTEPSAVLEQCRAAEASAKLGREEMLQRLHKEGFSDEEIRRVRSLCPDLDLLIGEPLNPKGMSFPIEIWQQQQSCVFRVEGFTLVARPLKNGSEVYIDLQHQLAQSYAAHGLDAGKVPEILQMHDFSPREVEAFVEQYPGRKIAAFTVPPSCTIGDAAQYAIFLQCSGDRLVAFKFNNTPLVVGPGDSYESVKKQYNEKYYARMAALGANRETE